MATKKTTRPTGTTKKPYIQMNETGHRAGQDRRQQVVPVAHERRKVKDGDKLTLRRASGNTMFRK